MKSKWLAPIAGGLLWALPAQAQAAGQGPVATGSAAEGILDQAPMVRAVDPTTLVRALQGAGYSADLGADPTGDPMITSGASGSSFQILFYNCTGHKQCSNVQFFSGYESRKAIGLARINEWNRDRRFARAFLDKKSRPILQMDVNLDDGGMSPLLFIDHVEVWAVLLAAFEQHIGYRK
jgi:hypothetical protein